jgi:G:T-mismatch repair DNA endonuclease (very short patch repair protein)
MRQYRGKIEMEKSKTRAESCRLAWSDPERKRLRLEQRTKTYLAHYGVEHPMQTSEIVKKVEDTTEEHYGVRHALESKVLQEKAKQTCLKNNGVEYPMQSEVILEKAMDTCIKKYGVHRPTLNPEIRQKVLDSTEKAYGSPVLFAVPEYQRMLKTQQKSHSKIEYKLVSWFSELLLLNIEEVPYVVNNTTFYPDILVKRDPNKVIDVFGCFWHQCSQCGVAKIVECNRIKTTEQERVSLLKQINIDCLVVWEHEFKDKKNLKSKVQAFLNP